MKKSNEIILLSLLLILNVFFVVFKQEILIYISTILILIHLLFSKVSVIIINLVKKILILLNLSLLNILLVFAFYFMLFPVSLLKKFFTRNKENSFDMSFYKKEERCISPNNFKKQCSKLQCTKISK